MKKELRDIGYIFTPFKVGTYQASEHYVMKHGDLLGRNVLK